MTEFSRKLLSGAPYDPADWENHLIEAHRNEPSMTPAAFAAFRARDGKNSYEKLAEAAPPRRGDGSVVLDLACGDGALLPYCLKPDRRIKRYIGVDMSDAALAVARNRSAKNVEWMLSKAAALPLSDASVDAVLCHMTFMLLMPIEPVVGEVHRVLKDGGVFAAIVSNPEKSGGLFARWQAELREFLTSEFPAMSSAKVGDPRVSTVAGLGQLFNRKTGFHDGLTSEDFTLDVRLRPGTAWTFFKDFYLVGMLPPPSKERLRARLDGFVNANLDPDGILRLDFPMRKFVAVKTSPDGGRPPEVSGGVGGFSGGDRT